MPELTVTHKRRTTAKPIRHTGDPRILKTLYDALYRPYGDFVATVKTHLHGADVRTDMPAEEYFYPK